MNGGVNGNSPQYKLGHALGSAGLVAGAAEAGDGNVAEESTKGLGPAISGRELPTNPAEVPKEGFEWRGKGPVGGDKGAWYHPETGESLHPDLNHEEPIGSHWDYKDVNKNNWRLYPDGRWEGKYHGIRYD